MSTKKRREATIEKERKVYNFLLECTMRDGGYIGTYREVSEALDCVGSEGDAHHAVNRLIKHHIVCKVETITGTRYSVMVPWQEANYVTGSLKPGEPYPPTTQGAEFYRSDPHAVSRFVEWVYDKCTEPGALGEVRMRDDEIRQILKLTKSQLTSGRMAAVSHGMIAVQGTEKGTTGPKAYHVALRQTPTDFLTIVDAWVGGQKHKMATWREPVPVSKALRSGPKGAPRQDTVPVSTSSTPVAREPVTTIKATQAPLPLESGEPSDDMALAIYYAAIKAKAMVGAKAKGGWWLLDGQAGRDLGSFGSGVDLPKHRQQECFLALHRKGYVEAGFDRARQAWQYMIK